MFLGAIHKQRHRFLAILDPSPPHIDPYRLLNAPPSPPLPPHVQYVPSFTAFNE